MSFTKKMLAVSAFLLLTVISFAQSKVITWKGASEQSGNGEYVVKAIGTFTEAGWHIYALGPYDGPNATALTVNPPAGVTLVGKPYITSKVKEYFDETWGMDIGICEETVVVCQKVKVTSTVEIPFTIEWQACNEGSCIAPDEENLSVKIEVAAPAAPAQNEVKAAPAAEDGAAPAGDAAAAPAVEDVADEASDDAADVVASADAPAQVTSADEEKSSSKSIWALILEAIGWGFVALLTPCVFPMIPMTVSFFLKQNSGEGENKKGRGRLLASAFGIFIVLLYTLPIAVIILSTYIFGGATVTADIFNWLATHWLPNILFFLIFMIFAASFFGAFEITLPSSIVNKSDSKSNSSKGLGGVFFIALTLVLVSFSCTGPIVGSVLIKSTQGEFWEPILTMLAFSVAFALPFTILAFAPSLLNKLPKSGGWLNSVKVVLGFVEVALGFKFLSVADQTYHWGLLDREVYLAIWIVVFALLGLYLLGKIRFAYDSPVEHLSVFRLVLVITVFTFVVYMIPGMWGAPLKALSGYLPPITTQDFNLDRTGRDASTYVIGVPADQCSATEEAPRKYSDFLDMPFGIEAFFDYNEAMEYARKVGKPVFVDFTGHGCVNCREMEQRVWSDPRVLKMMKNDYVICALYADDKKVVDESDWVTVEGGKVLKTLGKINSHFALERFNVNAQPYYAILDPQTEQHKMPSRGYNLDVEAFIEFLQGGLK